jgi:hypothetical protein
MSADYRDGALQAISRSSFHIESGDYIYAQVATLPSGKHFLLSQDATEITVVTTLEQLAELDLIERNKDNYRLIRLDVDVPFYSVGFLATVCDALAAVDMNVLVVSTYSKDYVLVRSDLLETAERALLGVGFKRS